MNDSSVVPKLQTYVSFYHFLFLLILIKGFSLNCGVWCFFSVGVFVHFQVHLCIYYFYRQPYVRVNISAQLSLLSLLYLYPPEFRLTSDAHAG